MIVGMAWEAVHANTLIGKLTQRTRASQACTVGRLVREVNARVEQLELAIEALEVDEAERLAAAPVVADAVEASRVEPARRPLPDHLPRESVIHPGPCACPSCGGVLRRIGEGVTETLDYLPGRFKAVVSLGVV